VRDTTVPFFLSLLVLSSLLQSRAEELPSPEKWAEAAKAIVRVQPTKFISLPEPLMTWLAGEGYTVPQSCVEELHNVLSGDFEGLGKRDWAVLASRNDSSAVLVFFGGSPRSPSRLDLRSDKHYLQTAGQDSIAYSRLIMVADSLRILGYIGNSETDPLTAITHDGIEDYFCGKASYINYYDDGHWRVLPGAD
jgi:hypothetical protein